MTETVSDGVEYTASALKAFCETGIAEIGAHSYGAPRLRFFGSGNRFICGRYCSFAPGVQVFLGGNHRADWVSTYPFPAFPLWAAGGIENYSRGKGDVRIGNDVWVGWSAVIASGVSVADGAVIGTLAMVTKDVPPYAIVAGNPARVVGYRFPEDQIVDLLRIRWWDWPDEKVKAEVSLLMSGDVAGFIRRHAP